MTGSIVNASMLDDVYHALLGRAPDEVAVAAWLGTDGGSGDLAALLASVTESDEYRSRLRGTLQHAEPSASLFNDRSQFGEVRILVRQMVNNAARHRIVVDVGANGRERSNSYDLIRYFGWTGLLIEANPHRAAVIQDEFAGLDYRLVTCAVSDYSGTATFHLGVNDDVSSLDAATAESWGPTTGEVTVEVRPLPTILAEQQIPFDFDYLTVDAEGQDVRILNATIASGYRPSWIILEAVDTSTASGLDQYGFSPEVQADYQSVGRTKANLVLCRRGLRPS